MERFDTHTEATRNVQRYLRQLSYHDSQIVKVPVDGVWGTVTADGVRSYQTGRGLPVTGTVNEETFSLLYADYLVSLAEHTSPTALDLYPRLPDVYAAKNGEVSFLIEAIQYLLGELSERIDDYTPPPRTGIYDAETEEAVRQYQTLATLPVTGQVDRNTWNHLAGEFNKSAFGTRY